MHKNYNFMMMIDEFTDKEQKKNVYKTAEHRLKTIKSIFQTHTIFTITMLYCSLYATAN